MQGDVAKGERVAVDVEGADAGGWVGIVLAGGLELAEEVLREIRGSCGVFVQWTLTRRDDGLEGKGRGEAGERG